MSDKKIVLYDKNKLKDTHGMVHKTDIQIINPANGELLFRGRNKVIIPGSVYTACKHFNIFPSVKLPTYNTALGLDDIQSLTDSEENASLVCLFCMGIDGCGPESSQVYDVNYTKWINPDNLIPFRYQISDNDLSDSMREKYFGRKTIAATDRIAYYFKAFDMQPTLHMQYIDGTPVDENVFISDNLLDAETYIELKLSVTKEDFRDYFIATTGINDAKVNTISLLTGYPKIVNGYKTYQGVRPLTKLNFPNESLIDLTKGIDIIYHIYY